MVKLNFKKLTAAIVACLIAGYSIAQGVTAKYNLYDLNESGKLRVFNRTLNSVTDKNYKGIHFSENEGEGVAWLEGVSFTNGTIEVDIKGRDMLQKSFVGVAFHGKDDRTFDAIYFRPFNFQTPDSVRHIHAVQYISHPDFTWEFLRKNQNGKYEKAIPSPPNPDEWFHAKIVVAYPHISVYVNGSSVSCLSVDKLNERPTGKIGLWVGHGADGSFANLKISSK